MRTTEDADTIQKLLTKHPYRPSELSENLGIDIAKVFNLYLTPFLEIGVIRKWRKGRYVYYEATNKKTTKSWNDILQNYFTKLTDEAYVYVLYFGKRVYIGKTRNLDLRLHQHETSRGKADAVDVIHSGNDENTAILENMLITNAITQWGKENVTNDASKANGALDYVMTTVRLPRPLYYALKKIAQEKDTTVNTFIVTTMTRLYHVRHAN